jgi:hypothetical protein
MIHGGCCPFLTPRLNHHMITLFPHVILLGVLSRCELEVAGAAARQRLMAGQGGGSGSAWARLSGPGRKPGRLRVLAEAGRSV